MLRFASLGSGSRGNATLVEYGQTRILIDCGFSLAETERRLYRLGCAPSSLSAILVTHEHSDHASGVGRLSRRYQIPVWLTVGTFQSVTDNKYASHHFINTNSSFSLQDFLITPLVVPHDAREPCQFIISSGAVRLAVLTDLGSFTDALLESLHQIDGLLLECNYEHEQLLYGPYTPVLKNRISGRFGHLANHQATALLKSIDKQRLQQLVGMHLSECNNTPLLAQNALSEGVGAIPEEMQLANQADGFSWRGLI